MFPQFVLDLFDTSRLLVGAMTNAIETILVTIAVVVLAPLALSAQQSEISGDVCESS